MDFQKIDTGDDEDELFFEGPEPEVAPVVKPARKRAAKGKAAEVGPAPIVEAPPIAEPIPAPVESVVTAEDPVSDGMPVGEPVVIVRGSRVPTIAMALAAVAALFASVGLLVTLRTMATLETARHEIERREAELARLPALLEEVESLARQQRAELAQAAAQRPSDVATKADLTRQMTELRFGLSRMQAPGTAALAGVVRAGQDELADRIDDLGKRVDAVEHPKAPYAEH